MINTIIFSYNRASQLRLLLESIEKHAKDVFKVNIIYKFSRDDYKLGYEKLKNEKILENANWVSEINFKEDVLSLFNKDYKYTCFFTDDDIFYFPVKEDEITKHLEEDQEVFCFSTRLGLNTTYCYTMNAEENLYGVKEYGDFIKWNWAKHYLNFGYSLSVNGNIFRTKEISKLVKNTNFHNPNSLEGGLQMFDTFPKEYMVAYTHSCLVNSPNNIVNETHPNRKGEKYAYSTLELNDKYLTGEVIDYDVIDFSDIRGAHQELLFTLKKI